MEDLYQMHIDECFRAYKELIQHQAAHPDDESLDMWESKVLSNLEQAIEEKVKRRLQANIEQYLNGEQPF